MIRFAKSNFFRLTRLTRLETLVLHSSWRSARLLILGYHGVSLDDEHQWDPALFMSPSTLRRRFQILRDTQCAVLPLGQAMEGLRTGTLPARAVVLTFDDGFYDFAANVVPLAREFDFPVTAYQSTYYSVNPLPVFPVMLSYLLWKGRGRRLSLAFDRPIDVELHDDNRATIAGQIVRWTIAGAFDARRKDELLHEVAQALGLDYGEILHRRIMQLMTLKEIRQASNQPGVSVELHTHRHRTPRDWRAFAEEINRNREILAGATGRSPTHFCYPSGRYQEQYFEWLPRLGIESAVTCQPGLANADQNPFALSRFIDAETVSENVFRAWISGVAEMLPRRTVDHSLQPSPAAGPRILERS